MIPIIHRVSIHAMYYKIAREHEARYASLNSELEKLETRPVSEDGISAAEGRMEACYEEREQAAVIAITFAAMSLEAFFYDYAADQLGDDFTKDNLDKLDPKSKFLVFPRLVCGKQPDKSGRAYQSLHNLISLRNRLVHFKSRSFPLEDLSKASDFHTDLNAQLKKGVRDAISCVALVMEELDRIHEKGPFFRQRLEWSI